MTLQNFYRSHANLRIDVPRYFEPNPLDSATDPTQDVPLKNVQVLPSGEPFNVKVNKGLQMSNCHVDQMTAIDRRNMDKFDIFGAAQQEMHAGSKSLNQFKQPKKQLK